MNTIPLTVAQAEEFLRNHDRHYKTGALPICAIGVAEGDRMCGAAILGCTSNDREAELVHIYVDGTFQGYSILYGACWRALKALGYRTAVL